MTAKPIDIETRIKVLNSVLDNPKQRQAVERELLAAKGDLIAASAALKGKVSLKALQRLQLADMVVTAVGDQPKVARVILDTPGIKTPRDVAKRNVDQLIKLIAPAVKPGTKAYQLAKSQAIAINNQSFAREPLTVLHRMTIGKELPIADAKVRTHLGTFLKRIPAGTDIRTTPIHKFLTENVLKGIPEKQRPAVVDQAKALWRTMAITPPKAPQALTILMKTNRTSAFLVGEMPESTFLNAYSEPMMGKEIAQQVYTNAINTRTRNEHALIAMRETIRGTGLAAIDGTETFEQRGENARHLAETNDVPLNFDTLFGDMDYCECEECQSVYSASAYYVELLNFLRNNNLGSDPATGGTNPNIRPDPKDISGTPLEKLFHRRPDLEDLELSCENTNTVLPYIDLVNEVMESYVVHRTVLGESEPKLDAYNITDETKEELLAQPLHTDYRAYCILKNAAVYPFTLPFHQPIEAARIFLKYLGTSRYEVLDSFRAAHESLLKLTSDPNPFSDTTNCNQQEKRVIEPNKQLKTLKPLLGNVTKKDLHTEVLDRAADAEFLGLTQEEYIILTKEAFWPKEYFDTTQKTTYSNEQYQKTIGVKQVHEYYGYADQAALLDTNEDPTTGQTGLHFVKKQFLPRTGIQYTDLVELLKTRYINPLYPKGLALAILENIQASYSFLKTLVDESSTDPKIRFAQLIHYLENSQSWISVPQVFQAFSQDKSPKASSSKENPLIRQWVYGCFEKLGKLIVLESGEVPQMPISGSFYAQDTRVKEVSQPELIGTLQSDGTILNSAGVLIGRLTVTGQVVGSDGNPIVNKYPSYYRIYLQDNQGNEWLVTAQGISGANKNQGTSQQPPKDTCNLDKVRLMHLDGSHLGGGGPQLPLQGKIYTDANPGAKFVGVLRKDGTIVDDSNAVIAHATLSGDVIDTNGKNFATDFSPSHLNIIDDKGARVGWINAKGLYGINERHPVWSPSNLDEFDRMQRFIRLWRKLGWTIDEVDKALEGLATKTLALRAPVKKFIMPLVAPRLPAGGKDIPSGPIRGFNNTPSPFEDWTPCGGNETGIGDITPDFLHQLVAVKKLLDRTGLPLIKLLSFWADISTAGKKSLYSRLFLTHNMVGIDDVFQADDNGNYLTGSGKITDHLPVLMAALNLKADDITAIVKPSDASTEALLTLPNVSEIYRHGLLAKALHLKVSDLADLKDLLGNLFADADATLKLFETWEKMEDAGFTFRQLTYCIKSLDNPLKPYAPSQKTLLQIAKTLYDGLNAIDRDNQDVTDAEQATTELVRTKAGQIFEPQVVEQIIGLLDGTTVYSTKVPAVMGSSLYQVGEIDINLFKKEYNNQYVLIDDILDKYKINLKDDTSVTPKQLTGAFNELIGILNLAKLLETNEGIKLAQSGADKETIIANKKKMVSLFPLTLAKSENITVPDSLAGKIRYTIQKDVEPHQATLQITGILTPQEEKAAIELCNDPDWNDAFVKRIDKQTQNVFNDALADIIPSDHIQEVKSELLRGDETIPTEKIDPTIPHKNTAPRKRHLFLYYFMPFLRKQLTHRFIVETVSGSIGLSREITEALLSDVLKEDKTSESAESVLVKIKDEPAGSSPSWYLIPPEDGDYTFAAIGEKTALGFKQPAPIKIDGESLEFKFQQEDPPDVWLTYIVQFTDPASKLKPKTLKKGQLYKLEVTDRTPDKLQWKTSGTSRAYIPTSALLPDHLSDAAASNTIKNVFTKIYKAAIVVNGFNLSADEVCYFQSHGADFFNLDFNKISLESWKRLAAYTMLRASLPKVATPLLDLFAWACQPDDWTAQTGDAEKFEILAKKLDDTTKWGTDRIKALIAPRHFDLQHPADFKSEVSLVKMQKAIAVADKVGVDIVRLFNWAVPGSKFWPCHTIAEDIRMAMRARFDAEDWEQAVKPLSDQLREIQKQALIAFLLTQPDLKAWPVVDADSLFEFFLIDVQMQAERQTSRMVQAIASVQLFIKRCLMGLEEKKDSVPVDAIDRDRWEWMQKYRVWEANRKVFLYPENWIRPELRDDKSPFYKELESELLQKDINPQTVEEALKNYLYKVDEVANLQVVGLYLDNAGEKLHVFARTRNAPYFFFYRYFDTNPYGQYWYPWEKMQVDIPSYDVENVDDKGKIKENGTYLIPVVCNNRLLVFFPQFMKKTVPTSSDKSVREMAESTSNNLKPTELWEIKMAWSEYRKGKWTQKQVSTDAIYCSILPNNQISSYIFLPTIISTGLFPKVGIDVYHKIGSYTPPAPQPILLQSAKLATGDGSTQISGIDVTVTSLVDKDKCLIASMIYPATELSLPLTTPTKDQCKGFHVDIKVHQDLKGGNFYIFPSFMVTLTFADQDVINTEEKSITFTPGSPDAAGNYQYIPLDYSVVYPPPDDPVIDTATLIIDIDAHADGKNAETWFDVSVYDQNGVEFASATQCGKGEPYISGDHKVVTITPYKKLKKAECQGFGVKITMFPHDPWPDLGWDTWEFNATANLSFGSSNLMASKKIKLTVQDPNFNKNIFSDSITSTDPYIPPTTTDPYVPPPGAITDAPINQRFEFSGNRISVANIQANDLKLEDYYFHYKEGEDWKYIHSFQAEDNKAPALINSEPYFEDPQPRFHDTETQLFIPKQQPYTFSYLSTYKLLSELNTDKIGNLYKYYLALYDINDPTKAGMADVYGAPNEDKGQPSYHELKRPYSLYNWEVCFHAPMQLVEHLLKTQQFDQAIAMLHYVFNPLARPGDGEDILQRCWQFPPFKEIMNDGIARNVLQTIFQNLKPNQPDTDNGINEWRDDPFQPHSIARIRPSAYMKYVVMKYIEILIAYGDYYFRQNTNESIPMAIQCYVMASHLYGPRGQKIPPRGKLGKETFKSLLDKWDAFGNAMVEMELEFPFSNQTSVGFSSAGVGLANIFGSVSTLYFSIPNNPNLTALRDTIDDRLLKIRSCENIEGIFQQPPLFEPSIDPALLVQAAAQGLSLSSVLNDMNSPMPNYRFYFLLQKALELCSELKSLGNAFLSTKEKGDAEALSNTRASHETSIQNLIMEVRKQQLEEANKSVDALQQSRKGPKSRMEYYLQLIGEAIDENADFSEVPNQLEKPLDESGLKLIKYEKEEMDRASDARNMQAGVGAVETLSSILHIIPDFSIDLKYLGIGAGTSLGGSNLGNAAQAIARGLQIGVSDLSYQSSNASKKGGFLRQLQDRVQQANAAGYEIKTIDKQILTQQIRIAIANLEINNQQKQIDNAQEVEEYLRNKYTNEELYSWMEGEIRTLYYQAYTLAYDLAKKVEKTYRFERGLSESNFIQFGYWDAGRDGLLAGERLYLALKQLEAAYQEKRGYDFEITKHVSLRQLDPFALIRLRETGTCEFAIPEVLFDMDHPGHYMRRIKSVALTVPCVVGPYTSLNCTLRLLEHKFRTNAIVGPGYAETTDATDERFSTVSVPITSIAVSSGQNDSGVFELNFRDERYIPFEGAGAISKWRMELPNEFRQFDYDTISDIILHLRYTSVDGGDNLQRAAAASVQSFIASVDELSQEEGLFAVFDLKHDFSNEWSQAMQPSANATERVFLLNKLYDRLPIFTKGHPQILATDIYLFTSNGLKPSNLCLKQNNTTFNDFTSQPLISKNNSLLFRIKDKSIPMDNWQLIIQGVTTVIEKMWLIVRYTLT